MGFIEHTDEHFSCMRWRRARAEAEERLGRQVAALQARCADAEADCTALREARHGAEAAAADTTRRLATAEGSAAVRAPTKT
jgi:hypothetical protein